MTNVDKLTIKQLHELFEKKTISPSELLRETMQRARDAEPKINAFRDFTLELASESARIADIKFSTGKSNTQILGIPFSVKDNIDIEGIKSCFGSLSTPGQPNISAPVVKSLMASGGCLIGKTNMTEFGAKASSDSPLSGITSNPRNLNYTTGGSSAGAAASVAAGVTSFAIGTDGGGSARIPASFCGLVGFKPTFGLIPVHPPPIVGDLFHISIIARNIADILEVLKVVTGQNDLFNKRKAEARISFKSLCTNKKNKKIRFFWSFSNQVPDADVKNVMEVARTEIFGPVLSVIPFETEEEAIQIANDTDYGLTNYIQTQDTEKVQRVARKLRSGMVDVNGAGIAVDAPFGGFKHSGIGREAGEFGLEEFLEVKAVGGWS